MWNELKTSGDISKYEKLAAKDRKRYEKEKGVAPTKTKKARTKKTEHVQNDTRRKRLIPNILCPNVQSLNKKILNLTLKISQRVIKTVEISK